jgi:hypothetical protein
VARAPILERCDAVKTTVASNSVFLA